VAFVGGAQGEWRVESQRRVAGPALAAVAGVRILEGAEAMHPREAAWTLRGVTGHERYVTRREHDRLAARQPPLGRHEATQAALIPIAKSESWWELAQDERRCIFEERSRHIALSLDYLPAIARRLHHARDLGEPFDFVTWFEFDPADAPRFDELLEALRATEEWTYVEREVDIRLSRNASDAGAS